MNKIKWIFFDVGSTLIDETECYNHRIRDTRVKTFRNNKQRMCNIWAL